MAALFKALVRMFLTFNWACWAVPAWMAHSLNWCSHWLIGAVGPDRTRGGQSDQITVTIPTAGKTTQRIILLMLSVKVLARNNSTQIFQMRISWKDSLRGWVSSSKGVELPDTNSRGKPFPLRGLRGKGRSSVIGAWWRGGISRSCDHPGTQPYPDPWCLPARELVRKPQLLSPTAGRGVNGSGVGVGVENNSDKEKKNGFTG